MKKTFILFAFLTSFTCYGRTGDDVKKIGTGIIVGIFGIVIVGVINWVKSVNNRDKDNNKPL